MHVSLDGFVAGTNGEMDWIRINEQMFHLAGRQTAHSDTAIYGRITFEMMDAYWPTAADGPNPSAHDIEHSTWYNSVPKIVLSHSQKGNDRGLVRFIGDNIQETITGLKNQSGKDIVIFGRPSAVRSLTQYDLIDRFWLFVNPIILGSGIPMFNGGKRTNLSVLETTTFDSGVIATLYERIP